jgi:hypothetical protein
MVTSWRSTAPTAGRCLRDRGSVSLSRAGEAAGCPAWIGSPAWNLVPHDAVRDLAFASLFRPSKHWRGYLPPANHEVGGTLASDSLIAFPEAL